MSAFFHVWVQLSMPDPTEFDTPRGFHGYLNMTDTYGSNIQVQQSSAAFNVRCWLRVKGAPASEGGVGVDGSGHLSISQAERVRDALDEWITWARQAIAEGYYEEEGDDDDA